jgi:hypothetical protein
MSHTHSEQLRVLAAGPVLLVAQAVISSLLAVCASVDLAAWGMATWVRTPAVMRSLDDDDRRYNPSQLRCE